MFLRFRVMAKGRQTCAFSSDFYDFLRLQDRARFILPTIVLRSFPFLPDERSVPERLLSAIA